MPTTYLRRAEKSLLILLALLPWVFPQMTQVFRLFVWIVICGIVADLIWRSSPYSKTEKYIFSAFGAAILMLAVWQSVFPPPIKLTISTDMPVLAHYSIPGTDNESLGLILYKLNLFNPSEKNVAIKEVIIRYKLNDKEFSTESHVIPTITYNDPIYKKDVNAIIMHAKNASLVLSGWLNIRTKIYENNLLPPSGVLSGSAIFLLGFNDQEQLSKLKKIDLVVIDYYDHESIHEILADKRWLEFGENNFIQ